MKDTSTSQKKYKNASLESYLNDLAARLPAPGGGSAAALTAGLGIALVSMVLNFTLGKPKYEKHEKELQELFRKSESLREKFLELVDLDIQAYRSRDLRDALDIPFMLSRLCFEGIKLCPPLIEKGNLNLVSDVAVAAVLLEAAFVSAYCNVQINLKNLGDKELTHSIRHELDRKEKMIRKIRTLTEEKVGKIIRG